MNIVFWFWGFLHGVRGEFTDEVSETAVGPIFTGREYEFASYSWVQILTHDH
jgi:hypothetical protein